MSDLREWTPPVLDREKPLKGVHCILERLDGDRHGAALWEAMAGHDALWDWMSVGPFADEAGFAAWLRQAEGATHTVFYTVCHPVDGVAFGLTSYLRDTPDMGVIEIGNITYAPVLQRTPATTEATMLLLAHAFAAGYRRVEWKCNARNFPSRRAAQRLGFSFEGVFRQHMIVKGASRDTAWFAMTQTEWPGIHGALQSWLAPENFDAAGTQLTRLGPLTGPFRVANDFAL